MVNYLLMISAKLENLTDLQPGGGCDDPNLTYYFKLKCGNCGDVTPRNTCVSLNERVLSAKGKSDTHLTQKCKTCDRVGTVTMLTGQGRPLTQEVAETQAYAPLMMFDCRGYEPLEFEFGSGWKAVSTKGTEMKELEDIDLSIEFYEYDADGECTVTISNLLSKFEVVK